MAKTNKKTNKIIFPCLYTHEVTATGFLHLYTNIFSTPPFPALNLPLPLTSLLKTIAWSDTFFLMQTVKEPEPACAPDLQREENDVRA